MDTHARRSAAVISFVLAAVPAGLSCGGEGPETTGGGKLVARPDGAGWSVVLEDPHAGGASSGPRLVALSYGRLVHVTARRGDDIVPVRGGVRPGGAEVVIRQSLRSAPGDLELSRDPITGREVLFIDRDVDDPAQRAEFEALLTAATSDLDPIQPRGLASTDVFSMVPRNAAIAMQFDDLLDPDSVDPSTVQLVTGDAPAAPSTPFRGRVLPSAFFGGRTPIGEHYPTRIVLDTTVSEVEAMGSDVLLGVNAVGLPPSLDAGRANVQLRIPTRRVSSQGLGRILTNLSGAGLAAQAGEPVDVSSAARPVTRAFRSGGRPGLVDDPGAGFLLDEEPPVLVGSTPVELLRDPVQVGGPDSPAFTIPELRFVRVSCGAGIEAGDVIVQGGVFARVEPSSGASFPDASGLARDVPVRLIAHPELDAASPEERYPALWGRTAVGAATLESAFDPAVDGPRAPCFVGTIPRVSGPPGVGIGTDTIFTLRFSEPMDPDSLTAFDSVALTRASSGAAAALAPADVVVGRVELSVDRREVTYVPRQGLSHVQGMSESYFLTVSDGADGTTPPTDLAGNPVARIPEVRFTIDPDEATVLNGGRVQRFADVDEAPPLGSEWGGQILIDLDRQVLRPRPVLRSTAVIDDAQPMLATHFDSSPGGVVTPLSPYGSRLQAIWRHVDCGLSLSDPQDLNLDVEGLSWAPAGGSVVADAFDRFEMALGHCRRSPDEYIDPGNGFPLFPGSGLLASFGQNLLNPDRGDVQSLAVVHDRGLGYAFDGGDLYQASTGTVLMPFPLNRGVPFADRRYFTWRDTRVRARAVNLANGGTEPYQWFLARGLALPPPLGTLFGYRSYYRSTDGAQTAGLPLLMEFRVFPDSTAVGQNGWDISIAINSSRNPFFRAFSTGGIDVNGAVNTVDPTSAPTATGGYDPNSTPLAGARTPGLDPVVHLGAIDFVTRVSHAHSVWFEATIQGESGGFGGRTFDPPTIEPSIDRQPAGTELRTEFRGATRIDYLNDEARWGQELADWIASGGTVATFAGVPPTEGGVDNDGDPWGNDPTPGVPDFMADAFSLDLYGDYYNDRDEWVDVRTTPPTPRVPSVWPRHYPGLANPGITFQSDSAWVPDVAGIEDARFYQVRLTFIGNPETGQSPEVSAFAMTWSR